MNKKRILILIDWFLPAYKAGGPIRSVANLVEKLSDIFEISILTSAYDLDGTKLDVETDKWLKVNGYKVYYKTNSKDCFSFCKKILLSDDFDVVYLNSMYSVKFTIIPLIIRKLYRLKTKFVLAPRGMLGKGAVKIKPVKKRLYLFISRVLGFYSGILWHAASNVEAQDIHRFFGTKISVKTIPNLLLIPSNIETNSKKQFPSFVFTGRISPEKNLDFALDVLKKLKYEGNLIFHIYGLKEKVDYWHLCEQKIKELRKRGWDIAYKGAVPMTEIPTILRQYHFLFFPSKTENFGHSIAEALANGLPVIISDRTPWRQLLANKAGADLPLEDMQSFVRQVEKFINFSNEEYKIWSVNAQNFVKKQLEKANLVDEYKKLFYA